VKALTIAPILLASVASAAEDVPAWLRTATAEKTADYGPKVSAVVLYNEAVVTVEENGHIITTERFALRVISRAGTHDAHAVKPYISDTRKVRDLRAWVIDTSGEGHRLARDRYLEIGLGQDELYTDIRARVVDAEHDCDPGSVFGYESVTDDKSMFTQIDWAMQNRLPVHLARFSITTPPSWTSKAFVFNRPDLKPLVQGNTSTWEVRDLSFVDQEDSSASLYGVMPRIAISLFPAPGVSAIHGPSFNNWTDVSRWLSELNDAQAQPDAAIDEKVRSLASGPTQEAKIRALAAYVQQIRYVSIQTGLGRGGGYKPHSASTVFAKSYGDCKDKANLLRTMLKAAGIESWPVGIYSSDPLYVREEWPSPQQFNHAILAIRAPEGFSGEATLDSAFGRLLLFDPTDPDTLLGQLPLREQNSLALLIAGDKGSLLRMPSARSETNGVQRTIQAEILADGSLKGSLHEEYLGWSAALARRIHRGVPASDYLKILESRLTHDMSNASLTHVNTAETGPDGRFNLDLDFSSSYYAQIIQNRLMVFRPSILPVITPLPSGRGKHPAVIHAGSWSDAVLVQLPKEFEVDEKPDTRRFESRYGVNETRCKVDGSMLTYTHTLTLKSVDVPADELATLNDFAEKVMGLDAAPVVLARK
jgi:hypothetical protein